MDIRPFNKLPFKDILPGVLPVMRRECKSDKFVRINCVVLSRHAALEEEAVMFAHVESYGEDDHYLIIKMPSLCQLFVTIRYVTRAIARSGTTVHLLLLNVTMTFWRKYGLSMS